MINRNLNGKNNYHKPFLLKPAGKDYLWGGHRLKDDFSKEIEMAPLAETWECSTHPDGPGKVASGMYAGKLLKDVLQEHPEYLGKHPLLTESAKKGELPILIKLIDARQNLSVQVHPDDAYAMKYENGSLGKSEMWYIMDAVPDAELVYGFYQDMDAETLRKSLKNGTVEKYLQKVKVQKDDVFFIEAGTVHAIGAGVLLAEIQENSNLTYRLYDYNRVDKDGKKRELHIDKALDVVNLRGAAEPRQPMRVLHYQRGCASEFLCRCRYFQVERQMINTERWRAMAEFQTDSNSFQVLLCIQGCGVLFEEKAEMLPFIQGDCIFVPADSVPLKIHGKAQFLRIRC